MDRQQLAQRIAGGLAGWTQFQEAQGFGDYFGEDAVQLALVQIVRAQNQWSVGVSQLPTNWEGQRRVDVALLPWKPDATTWYGVIEVKYPTQTNRLDIVQDIVRVVSCDVANEGIRFLTLLCRADLESALFGDATFSQLLRRDLDSPEGSITLETLTGHFPDSEERVPQVRRPVVNTGVQTQLLAVDSYSCDGEVRGKVYIWQCNNSRGRPSTN